ncbi:MAG TPA: inorganic phosphate transporter [Acidimicrobiales bacterium]|nr:inorganic phosphate transporter [Acidimicrobiales bacterium]
MTALLVAVALAFAVSLGAHYTGACMGMPYALRTVSAWQALTIMAPLTLLGAALASHAVEHTVADRFTTRPLGVEAEIVVVGVAFAVTALYNRLRVPTSTIQILVFSLAGTALGAGVGVRWDTVGLLAVVWVAAPLVAFGLGFGLTQVLDRLRIVRQEIEAAATSAPDRYSSARSSSSALLAAALVVVGAAASFTMGGNDVANATGSLVATHTFSPLVAGTVGGAAMAAGVLSWGRPLLTRVAFDIVTLDRPMATAAQAVQAVVVLLAVGFGFFTSMNQALVGALAGTGVARGRQAVHRSTLTAILRGWLVGPTAGIVVALVVSKLVEAAGVHLR